MDPVGVEVPSEQKPMTDLECLRVRNPHEVRDLLDDGNFGGYYERSDDEMQEIWEVAVQETTYDRSRPS